MPFDGRIAPFIGASGVRCGRRLWHRTPPPASTGKQRAGLAGGLSGRMAVWLQRRSFEKAMAEVLVSYETPIASGERTYRARAIGRRAGDDMWEGWLEFIPDGAGAVLVGPVESRQPEHAHLVYWATGLTPVYLEGALDRARHPVTVRVRTIETPVSDAPAPREVAPAPVGRLGPEPILDPFEIGARSLDLLRQELTALNRPRLLTIIDGYDLNPAGEDISWMTDAQLVHFIVVAVDTQLPQRIR
jgi:hypothetical protein